MNLEAKDYFANALVFEADLLLYNPEIITKYHYTSDYLGIKKSRSDDWCFRVKNGIITDIMVGGEGEDIWQMVGISYWNEEDAKKLSADFEKVFASPGGRERFWDQTVFQYKLSDYKVGIRDCNEDDVIEIDTFQELKTIDKSYDV